MLLIQHLQLVFATFELKHFKDNANGDKEKELTANTDRKGKGGDGE